MDRVTPRIRVLSESVVNKIAAGEVVETPASVIKELVENAIDAGAGRISVDLKGGGLKLIRVTDDGSGMAKDDLLLALERHSTSKISSADDLQSISTLGFRGEAVPSIAAVSKLRIISRTEESDTGWMVEVRGGSVRRLTEQGTPRGTIVEVKDLFFNTPVRREYLGGVPVEVRKIGLVMQRYILSHPEISFSFSHNNREMGRSSGNGDLRENLMGLFGREALEDLILIENRPGETGLYDLFGYVSRPGLTRSGFKHFYFFLNSRYIESKELQKAVMEAYHTLLPKGRYPLGVLFLQLDPATINQNVHPTKQEVRFLHADKVCTQVTQAISETLHSSPASKAVEAGSDLPEIRVEVKKEQTLPQPDLFSTVNVDQEQQLLDVRKILGKPSLRDQTSRTVPETPKKAYEITSIRPIGQVFSTYIVVDAGDEVILVDQHAAHERIRYEQLMDQYSGDRLDSQGLLFPAVIDIKRSDIPLLQKHRFKLERLGIVLEHFGGESYLVKSLPVLLGKITARDDVHDVIDDLLHNLYVKSIMELKEKLITTAACRSSVKAGDSLSIEEMRKLLEDLLATKCPATCPHGRPTMVSLPRHLLEKNFLRK